MYHRAIDIVSGANFMLSKKKESLAPIMDTESF